MNIGSVNIDGRNGNSIHDQSHKFQDIHRLMKTERLRILGILATHLSAEQTREIQNSFYGDRMQVYSTLDPEHPNSAGMAIVLNKDLTNIEGVKVWYLIPGRAMMVTIPWHGTETITILAVYPPNDTMTNNAAFWRELIEIFIESDIPIPNFILGDMNVTEDKIDRLPECEDDTNASVAHAAFKTLLGMQDGWRKENEGVKEFTHTHMGENYISLSRLDRIYVSQQWRKRCRNWTISDAFAGITDHKMVTVQFATEVKTYQGQGRYMMQKFSPKNPKFMDQIVEIGLKLQKAIECTEDNNPADAISQMLFENFKDETINIERNENKK
ncbi:Endonuclease/exonuclease/phosphatase, partial [Mycena floridula]